jgi:CTP:molybdopterin cytidylyltransferase MocA
VGISAAVVTSVVDRGRNAPPGAIVIPTREGHRGHPVWFPWAVAEEVLHLPEGLGVNAVVAAHAGRVIELDLNGLPVDADLDTPEDFARWSGGS